jgi:hypothetical protein
MRYGLALRHGKAAGEINGGVVANEDQFWGDRPFLPKRFSARHGFGCFRSRLR